MSERSPPQHNRTIGTRRESQSKRSQPSTPGDALPKTFGRLSLDQTETSYVGSDHWAAIIDGIAELKTQFNDSQQSPLITDRSPSMCGEEGPEIFHGHVRSVTREDLISSLPPKCMADALISTYFSQQDQIPIFMHRPTFYKDYQRFWLNINEAPIMWIGLLYCVLCLGSRIQSSFESKDFGLPGDIMISPSLLQVQEYRERTVQCLHAGSYIKPSRYTIETLLLYLMTEHHHHTDAQFGNWILMGQIARIAMRLGLHRDPSHASQVSPFDGEMRRRLWTAIVQVDLTTSSQMGLPRMINESYCDTEEPGNYLEGDIDDEMTDLPPPRPDSVVTPILYLRTRNRLLSVFAKVSDMTTAIRPSTFAEAWDLDSELVKAHGEIPEGLKINIAQFTPEDQSAFVHRINLDAVFHHARCILHRPYLIPARNNDQYQISRKTCVEAALALLRHQQTLYMETMPGGQYEVCRWKLSSFWNHGMLLAVTVICVDLNKDFEDGLINPLYWQQQDRRELAESLRSAQQVLLQSWNISADARKGATAVEVVLSKAGYTSVMGPDPTMTVANPAQDYVPVQTSNWSLDELLQPGFPQFQQWDQMA